MWSEVGLVVGKAHGGGRYKEYGACLRPMEVGIMTIRQLLKTHGGGHYDDNKATA
jgi:hypothetical protein